MVPLPSQVLTLLLPHLLNLSALCHVCGREHQLCLPLPEAGVAAPVSSAHLTIIIHPLQYLTWTLLPLIAWLFIYSVRPIPVCLLACSQRNPVVLSPSSNTRLRPCGFTRTTSPALSPKDL